MSLALGNHHRASKFFIAISIFLDVLCVGIIIPVLPSLIGQFTSSRSEQAFWYGALAATYGTMQFFFAPFLGALSDRYGRRPILLLSLIGFGCSLFAQATATSLAVILFFRIVSGATGASYSVARAYIADITAPEQRSKAFGLLSASIGCGYIFGPVFGGVLGDIDVRVPFYVASGLSVLNFLYGFFVLPESLESAQRCPISLKKTNPFTALLYIKSLASIRVLTVVYAFTVFAQFILQTTWVMYTQFKFNWSPIQNGLVLAAVGLTSVVVQGGLQSRLTGWLGEEKLTLWGLLSASVAYLMYGLSTETWMIYAIVCANLLGYASGPALQAIISNAVDVNEQGFVQGALSAINSLAVVLSPLIGTFALASADGNSSQSGGYGLVFLLCAVFQFGALLLAIMHFRNIELQGRENRPSSAD